MPDRFQPERILVLLAMAAILFHAVATALLHLLVPQVDPLADMASAYLYSDHQVLSRCTFLALGVALASLGLALRTHLSSGLLPKAAAALLVVSVVGFIGVAGFPEAAAYFAIPTQPATVLSILLLSISLPRDPLFASVRGILLAIAVALMGLFLLSVVLGTLISMGVGGLANRLVLVLIYIWVALVVRGFLSGVRSRPAGPL